MIIGLCGKAGSGKTTFAYVAVKEFGFTKLSFADGLKQEVKEFLESYEIPFRDENLWGTQEDKDEVIPEFGDSVYLLPGLRRFYEPHRGITFRHLLQFWGTDFRRKYFGEDYWTKKLLSQLTDGKDYIIDDVRFPNEADALRERDGLILRIVRIPEAIISGADHVSESAMNKYAVYENVRNTDGIDEYLMRAALTLYRLREE